MLRMALVPALAAAFALYAGPARADGPTASIEVELLATPAADLGAEAIRDGDASRGASIFHRPALMCSKCHAVGGRGGGLGPDLADWPRRPEPGHLVESILRPSAAIRQGYEPLTIALDDGRIITGLLAERTPEHVAIRRADEVGALEVVPAARIEAEKPADVSVMPAGLGGALTDRREFLDLVKYLAEIAEGGAERARLLDPPVSMAGTRVLPAYEAELDHAGLIRDLDDAAFERGRAIYERLCINCHGTPEAVGSIPSSRRFASEPFKNGGDPYGMYRTLTHGFGQMEAQAILVPRQKYDVIHFVREAFVRGLNADRYVAVTPAYLDALPKGTTRGPEPTSLEPWVTMDYGPFLGATIEVGTDGSNFAMKGLAQRLDPGPGGVARGRAWSLFDKDTMRLSAFWTGDRFLDWKGIQFDGTHAVHPRVVGDVIAANANGPGWADPATGSFDDPRPVGRHGRHYGPMPRSWLKYRGLHRYGDRTILAYDVGTTPVLEWHGSIDAEGVLVMLRSFELGPRDRALTVRLAEDAGGLLRVGLIAADAEGLQLTREGGETRLAIAPGKDALRFTAWIGRAEDAETLGGAVESALGDSSPNLAAMTNGGPALWPQPVRTQAITQPGDGSFAVDTLSTPQVNPWSSRVRPSGFDFLPDGRAAVCTWDGDVWIVSGLDRADGSLDWRRIAGGLFQPLGLKVVGGEIFVTCRDQIAILRDRNGDGEADFYDCFNDDHQVTEHFHEFAMGLQVDDLGNFYYAKAACHGLRASVPQHGTLLKVSPDGSKTEILATGFRAPNGVCLNPDGTFFLTDQEGFWTPKNRINLVRVGGFYGNMWGYTDVTDESDSAMEPPVCWITNAFDRSPSELLRVPEGHWGALAGSLLNFSYGYGKTYAVPYEIVDGVAQGGMSPLPIAQQPTGVMRGRFRPDDGHLYMAGMFAWAGNQQEPGDFYRVRYLGGPIDAPIGYHVEPGGLRLTFTDPIDPEAAADPSRFAVTAWSLKRTQNYGAKHLDERPWKVAASRLADDRRSVVLELPELGPTDSLEVRYRLKSPDGREFEGVLHGTIHRVPEG